MSERNLPDIALDVVDEAASEFIVKEEFARDRLPALENKIDEIEALFKACDGKSPAKNKADFDALTEACDEFTRRVGRMKDFWGHRLEAAKAGEEQ